MGTKVSPKAYTAPGCCYPNIGMVMWCWQRMARSALSTRGVIGMLSDVSVPEKLRHRETFKYPKGLINTISRTIESQTGLG